MSQAGEQILSQAGEPSVLSSLARGHLRPKGAPKTYPVLKVFRRYASFRVALGFAQASSSICSHSATAVSASCEGSIRLGLMVLRAFIRTIYHEVEIYESGAFERGQR